MFDGPTLIYAVSFVCFAPKIYRLSPGAYEQIEWRDLSPNVPPVNTTTDLRDRTPVNPYSARLGSEAIADVQTRISAGDYRLIKFCAHDNHLRVSKISHTNARYEREKEIVAGRRSRF